MVESKEQQGKREGTNSPNGEMRKETRIVSSVVVLIGVFLLFVAVCPKISYLPAEVDRLAGGIGCSAQYRQNFLGTYGCRIAHFLLLTFGLAIYPTLLVIGGSALRRMKKIPLRKVDWNYYLSFVVFFVLLSLFLGAMPGFLSSLTAYLNINQMPGGLLGDLICGTTGVMSRFVNATGCLLITFLLLLLPVILIWRYDWTGILPALIEWMRVKNTKSEARPEVYAQVPTPPKVASAAGRQFQFTAPVDAKKQEVDPVIQRPLEKIARTPKQEEMRLPSNVPLEDRPLPQQCNAENYMLPGVGLLDGGNASSSGATEEEINEKMRILQETFDALKVPAHVENAVVGPQVTLYRFATEPGYILNHLSQYENNLKMAMKVVSIRLLIPIPGESVSGIEVPNTNPALVPFRSLLEDEAWEQNKNKMRIPLLLGRDVLGKNLLLDLGKAPHLLIAGSTGSGKSVCMNVLIMSLLYRFRPDELRLIMVDPKVVEFQAYEHLPHLVVPVINDVSKVPLALQWAVVEMDRRLRIMAKVKMVNLFDFNRREVDPRAPIVYDDEGEPIPEKMPYVVIIIDELADIMNSTNDRKAVENLINRLAAKARAAGIHLILATQRPDVKVITGTIKSNLPTRIAFRVASHVDSMTILTQKGAETLLGRGDMLVIFPNSSDCVRMQCAMASDAERNGVVDYAAEQCGQCFDDSVLRQPEGEEEDGIVVGPKVGPDGNPLPMRKGNALEDNKEQLLYQAVDIILSSKRPTVSYIQRRLSIGYNHACNIMEILEKRGVVGPSTNSTTPRQVLISSMNDYLAQYGTGAGQVGESADDTFANADDAENDDLSPEEP